MAISDWSCIKQLGEYLNLNNTEENICTKENIKQCNTVNKRLVVIKQKMNVIQNKLDNQVFSSIIINMRKFMHMTMILLMTVHRYVAIVVEGTLQKLLSHHQVSAWL